MINNRQNGRRRGRGGGGGGGQRNGNPGRPDNGNRIDSRARGNANQLYEKYKNLANDAQRQGDRVNTEYYLQFADHYFRVLSESRSRFEEQQPRRQQSDAFDDFDDGEDYGDEGEPIRAGEQSDDARGNRDGGQRNGNQREQRYDSRQPDSRRDERYRNGHGANGGGNGQSESQAGDDERYARTAAPVANDFGEGDEASAAEPRRGRRNRRDRANGPNEGEAPAALDAERLPPSLGLSEETGEGAGDQPKPRRRRLRVASGGEAPQAAE